MGVELRGGLKRLGSPPIIGAFIFTLFSSTFIVAYVVLTHQHYLKTYNTLQEQEIKTFNQKLEAAFSHLEKLLHLADSQIAIVMGGTGATLPQPSKKTAQRIQNILSSLPYLQLSNISPSLQRIAFYKLSSPQMIVTRFGVLPFVATKVPFEKIMSQSRDPLFVFEDKALIARMTVMKPGNILEGVIEIQVDLADFKRLLGNYETIRVDMALASNENAKDGLQHSKPQALFLLSKNRPDSLWVYASTHRFYYLIFLVYVGFALTLMGGWNKYTQKHDRQKIAILANQLFTAKETEETLTADLEKHQKDLEIREMSLQAQKTFQGGLQERQKKQAKYIAEFLEEIRSIYSHMPLTHLNQGESDQIIDLCLKKATALSKGLWTPQYQETIDLTRILKNLYLLFGQKIHRSHIHLNIHLLLKLPSFRGDPLFIEMLLMNVVGKAIYRVPEKGIVSLSLKEALGFLHLKIQDNGYGKMALVEDLIRQSFELFIDEEVFQSLCQENGVHTKYVKAVDGFNVTHMVIPFSSPQIEESDSNVVQLFS